MRNLLFVLAAIGLSALAAGNATVGPPSRAVAARADAVTIPRMLSCQGRLTDTLGVPVSDTTHAVDFRLYTTLSGGSPFWGESQAVRTKGGLFSILLGSVTPVASLPDAGSVYLGMAVAGGDELSPRLRIVSAAYAYKSDTANFALAGGAGGDNAWVRGVPDSVLFTVKQLGIARGGSDNVLHGSYRQTHVNLGVACTTGTAGQDYADCTVSGGRGNAASGSYSTVSGGLYNGTSDEYSTVGGGSYNRATGGYSTIAGGQGNSTLAGDAAIGGGKFNVARGMNSAIAGGKFNTATGYCDAVGGGVDNIAESVYATVAGGSNNHARAHYAAVGGGFGNRATGVAAAVPGGQQNSARGCASFAAGTSARANHDGCFVWGDSSAVPEDSVSTTGPDQFRVRARGGTWFFSDAGMTTGAYLAPGSNSWSSACDSTNKTDFRTVDRRAVLEQLAGLSVRDYRMKGQNDGTRHIGPVAQEFRAAFGYGETGAAINLGDMDGVLLAAVQALHEENKALRAELAALRDAAAH